MIKKITELVQGIPFKDDLIPFVDSANGETKKALIDDLLKAIIPNSAGAHNGIYRGKDITALFYNGTLSQQIAEETFNDIFIGDYIIGKVSKRKYLVADINYRLGHGDTACTTPHVLMLPERIMGTAQMNATNTTTGGYVESAMHKTNLEPFRTIIQNDFETNHIVKHKAVFTNTVADGKASNWAWFDTTIDLMNECMVYGHNAWGAHHGYETGADKSQLSLFKLDSNKIIAHDDAGARYWYWLRDVASASEFAGVNSYGHAAHTGASGAYGVRPAFLIK